MNPLLYISFGLAFASIETTSEPRPGGAQARVAVIIPCFNDGELVGDAVHSIQEPELVELVVVDDGSDDDHTLEVLDGLRREGVEVIHQANQGVSAARMTGVRATTAPYLFPLDADDLAMPGVLTQMADRLDADRGAGICFGDYLEFGDRELVRAVPELFDAYRLSYTNEYPVSALTRRSLVDEVGGWKLRDGYEDWDVYMSLAERGVRGMHLGAGVITYKHRLHPGRRREALWANHRGAYRTLRALHPDLFERVAANRRASTMTATRKALYPLIYGGRPRWSGEPRVKAVLDRLGLWTLRR